MLKHAVLFIQGGSVESRILKVRRSWLFRKEQPKTSTAVMSRQAVWSDCEECRGLNFTQDAFLHQERKANFWWKPSISVWLVHEPMYCRKQKFWVKCDKELDLLYFCAGWKCIKIRAVKVNVKTHEIKFNLCISTWIQKKNLPSQMRIVFKRCYGICDWRLCLSTG